MELKRTANQMHRTISALFAGDLERIAVLYKNQQETELNRLFQQKDVLTFKTQKKTKLQDPLWKLNLRAS